MRRSCTEILEGEEESNCGIEFEGKYVTIQKITPGSFLSVASTIHRQHGNTFRENLRSSVLIHGRVSIYCQGK